MEEIYMQKPDGLEDCSKYVCRLNKALYGLKQAPRVWNLKFHDFVISLGFKRSENDYCLYIRKMKSRKMFILDIILTSNDINELKEVKSKLMSEFKSKDLGKLNYFLGINVTYSTNALFLSNEQFLRNVLKRFKMDESTPISTPLKTKPPRDLIGPCIVRVKPYRELVGCLMYVMVSTRPDLSMAVNFYSQFQSNATESQWVGLKRILRYIKGTQKYGLVFTRNVTEPLIGYADADWANEYDRKSISGYLFEVFGNLTTWCTKKQRIVTLSSTEAEYVALSQAACELIWLKNLLLEMNIAVQSVNIFEDNMSCIHLLTKPNHSRQKHIDVKYHFVKELIALNELKVLYINTNEQKADIPTKVLETTQFSKLRFGLDVVPHN